MIRDYLAVDRTSLANERTLLAYMRTFIGAFASGVGLVKLTDDFVFHLIGRVFIGLSPVILVVGFVRFFLVHRRLKTSTQRVARLEEEISDAIDAQGRTE